MNFQYGKTNIAIKRKSSIECLNLYHNKLWKRQKKPGFAKNP